MTQTFAPGIDVTLTFDLIDLNGDPVTPVSATIVVLNEEGEDVHTASVTLEPSATEATATVPGSANQLQAGEKIGSRTVELRMVLAGGGYVPVTLDYVLRGSDQITVPSTSFMTYQRAVAESTLLPNLLGWASATPADRVSALFVAYSRLTMFRFNIWRPEDTDVQNRLAPYDKVITPRMWPTLSLSDFNALSPAFRKALWRAQLTEADELLTGDVVGSKRRSGIMSETIGESSMMFRMGKPVEQRISKASYAYIASYIAPISQTIGRA